ncbi:MAG: hypothetical protein KC609_10965 [Myxococcales bacterium]|nr:hypothetical protein [Myxococcales bacterium]
MNGLRVLAITAVGLILWIFYLAIPAFYLELYTPTATFESAIVLSSPLALMVLGIYLKSREIMLLFYPVSVLLPVVIWRELASAQLHSGATFAVTTLFTLIYFTVVLSTLRPESAEILSEQRVVALHDKPLRASVHARSILGIYAALSLIGFVALIYLVNFHRPFVSQIEHSFGSTSPAARVQLNLFGFFIWLVAFYYSLVQSIRGRLSTSAGELESVELRLPRSGGRARLIAGLVLAVALMIAFIALIYYDFR